MLFNSISFLIFFPLVVVLFFSVPRRWQWILLLVASMYFYMAFVPWYILILLFLIVTDYCLGLAIQKTQNKRRRLWILIGSIVANLGTLFVFKYFNFFNENISLLAHAIGWNYSVGSLALILPIGLSFHVFQSLSYVIEVYRGNYPAERHLGIYALYVLFFPQLVAGPIERPQHLLPQLHGEKSFDAGRVMDGLTLMLWGFFKKLAVADQLAVVVDRVYGNVHSMPPAAILIAVVLFAFQLYCDFSGYSDIAVGAGRVLGFELMSNFNRPYSSTSIAEFWRRWHISLSNWLRDYLYMPLALSSRASSVAKVYVALFVTFTLIGLWHGAQWTFVMLGVTHGIYLIIGRASLAWRTKMLAFLGLTQYPRFLKMWRIVVVFGLVSVSWVFFRAPTLADAWHIIASLPAGLAQLFELAYMKHEILTEAVLGIPLVFVLVRVIAIYVTVKVERWAEVGLSLRDRFLSLPSAVRIIAYYGIVLWILFLGNVEAKTFIYFQF